jgi:uracil-DNA glycosylase family 4
MADARHYLISYLQQQKELLMPSLYLSLPLTLRVIPQKKAAGDSGPKAMPFMVSFTNEVVVSKIPIPIKQLAQIHHSDKRQALVALYEAHKNCALCSIAARRKKFIFGSGNAQSSIMIIGEATADDDETAGEPFSGEAGELLTKMLSAIHLNRKTDTFITTTLKCRPPANREATQQEVLACTALLKTQISIIQPKIMLLLGRLPALSLLGKTEPISVMRQQAFSYEGVPVLVTYHPQGLLKNTSLKRPAWEDLQKFEKLYKELGIHASA